MVTPDHFQKIVLSLKHTVELPHFEKASFRVNNKIYATLSIQQRRAFVRLSEVDQSLFCTFDASVVYPVPNKWGKQGWTIVELDLIEEDTLTDLVNTAYQIANTSKKRKPYTG